MSEVENGSGLQPCEYKILVKREHVEVIRGSILIPSQVVEKEQREGTDVTLVAKGGNAFEDFLPPIPQLGDRVKLAKYAGYTFVGEDGGAYTVCHDKDVAGILIGEQKEKELHDTDQPDNAGDGIYASLRSDNG